VNQIKFNSEVHSGTGRDKQACCHNQTFYF